MDKKGSWRFQGAEKVPTETFLVDVGPHVEIKRGPRSTQNRSKTQNNERYHWRNRVLSLLAPLAGARGKLSRFGVKCGSMWGRLWVDVVLILRHPRSLLGRSVCLSVCLSVCHLDIQRPVPNRVHCQICTAIISYRRYQDAHLKLHSSTLRWSLTGCLECAIYVAPTTIPE